ncbi:MAG: glutaredoxin 3 [Gammaproteobacteria bacterium]|nr:glutaredoxin 3 [Gammaproteobacteria bacterium]
MTAPGILLYTSELCGYCHRARRLLERKGVAYEEIRVDVDADRWREMTERSGRDTVPQLFIGERHVGGFDDMVELDLDGELDPLLGIGD